MEKCVSMFFCYSTIISYSGILSLIGDKWLGTPVSALSWNVLGLVHDVAWFSSLDNRSANEVTHLSEYGGVDQTTSNLYSSENYDFLQRPVLQTKKENKLFIIRLS